MFAIINIIIFIITGKSHARTWSWLQENASQFYLVPFSNPSGGKYSVAQGLSSGFMSKLFNGVLFIFSIRPQVSPLPPAKLSDDHPLRELWQWYWINIIGLKVWYRQKNTDFESYLFVELQSLFIFSTIFFEKCIKASTEKCTFPTTTKYTWFLILLCQN